MKSGFKKKIKSSISLLLNFESSTIENTLFVIHAVVQRVRI